MIDFKDSRFVINLDHYRNVPKEHFFASQNGTLFEIEKQTKNTSNGLSNIEYEVLSSLELAPKFTIINVDFKLISENK